MKPGWLVALIIAIALFAKAGCTPRTNSNASGDRIDPATLPATVHLTVQRFIDGDSFVGKRQNGQSVPVRISGIDAPERGQSGSRQADRALRSMLGERLLELRVVKRDRYGRLVGRLLADGTDVGLQLVRQGLAWHFKRYEHEQAPGVRRQYRQAQRSARDQGIGIWKNPNALPPWEWRRQARNNRKR